MTSRRIPFTIAFVLALGLPGRDSLAAVPVRTVAVTGVEAVGTVGGATYAAVDAVALDDLGRTAFGAKLAGPGVDVNSEGGLFSEGGGFLHLWAQTGWDAPSAGEGVTFRVFGHPTMNREGKIAFWSYLTGTGVGDHNRDAIWSNVSGVLQLVARTGDQAPGAPPGAVFRILVSDPLLNAAGHVAFAGILSDVGAQPPVRIGIFSTRSGSLAPVILAGAQAPGMPNGVYIADLATPAMNDSGQTVFAALFGGAGINDSNRSVIYSEGSGLPAPLARAGTQAPGLLPGVNFASFMSLPVINNAGRVAFLSTLTGTLVFENVNDWAIWSNRNGNVELVARTGVPAPGTPFGVVFHNFDFQSLMINSAGRVAFQGAVRGPGVTPAVNDTGIWSQGGGNLALIARAGSQAPGMPNGVVFDLFYGAAINASGRVAFHARMKGPGIISEQGNSDGIWAQTDSGLSLIVRGGDTIAVLPGDVRTVNSLRFTGGSGREDGSRSGFNDAGDIAYVAHFNDGSVGVFSTKLDLPNSTCGDCGTGAAASMAMALPLLFAARSRHRRRFRGCR